MSHLQRLLQLIVAIALISSSAVAIAGAEDWSASADGVVLDGYDVVAYFTEDRAVRGSVDHSAQHDGVTFYFATREHREEFAKDPSHFAPAFGGYCAFAVAAKEARFPADPRTFKIHDGQLLVFYNGLYEGKPMNTKVMWNANERAFTEKAAASWKKMAQSH